MRTTLTRALVGLGLAGALFLGAGAAVAQTTGDESSSTATTAREAQQNGNGYGSGAADCPESTQELPTARGLHARLRAKWPHRPDRGTPDRVSGLPDRAA